MLRSCRGPTSVQNYPRSLPARQGAPYAVGEVRTVRILAGRSRFCDLCTPHACDQPAVLETPSAVCALLQGISLRVIGTMWCTQKCSPRAASYRGGSSANGANMGASHRRGGLVLHSAWASLGMRVTRAIRRAQAITPESRMQSLQRILRSSAMPRLATRTAMDFTGVDSILF